MFWDVLGIMYCNLGKLCAVPEMTARPCFGQMRSREKAANHLCSLSPFEDLFIH